MTERDAVSVVVASETSIVPMIGCFACAGVIATAARAVSVLWSGQEIACGWYTVTLAPFTTEVCGQWGAGDWARWGLGGG